MSFISAVFYRMLFVSLSASAFGLAEVLAHMRLGDDARGFLCMAEGRKQTERRIVMLKRSGFFRKKGVLLSAAAVVVAAAVIFLTLPNRADRPRRSADQSIDASAAVTHDVEQIKALLNAYGDGTELPENFPPVYSWDGEYANGGAFFGILPKGHGGAGVHSGQAHKNG